MTSKKRQVKEVSNQYIADLETFVTQTYIQPSFPDKYNGEWEVLLTIRYDPKLSKIPPVNYDTVQQDNFWLFDEHVQRLKFTISFFQLQFKLKLDYDIDKQFIFDKLKNCLTDSQKSINNSYKFRLLVNLTGEFRVEIHDIPEVENLLAGFHEGPPTYNVFIDKQPTPMSPFTSFKTTKREHYTASRQRAQLSSKEEVLIYNTQLDVMEGSITSIAVRRKSDNNWITPPLHSGCLCGVTRHFLLRKNYLEEERIALQDLQLGEEILLFNGVMGVVKGKIAKREHEV